MEKLDPTILALTKAIRQAESGGNFTARSKDGSFGAYQFIKPTWEATAKKFGVNVEWEKATPQQQNEVAYKQVKEWKDKGFNVGQIASMWNAGAGRPNAYKEGVKGTNSSGVNYDVAGYAKKVATFYHAFKNGIDTPSQNSPVAENTTQPEAKEEKVGFVQEAVRGIVNPFLRFGANILKVGDTISGKIKTQEDIEAPYNAGSYLGDIKPFGVTGNLKQKLKETVGVGLEVGSTLLPVGKSVNIAKTGVKGAIKQAAIQTAKVGAVGGGAYGAGSALEENKSIKETAVRTGLGTVIGGLSGLGLGAAQPIVNAGISKVLNKIPQTAWSSILKRIPTVVAKNPKLESEIATEGIIGATRQKISQTFGKEIQNIELGIADILKGNKGSISTQNVVGYLTELKNKYTNIPGEQSSIKAIDNIIEEVIKKGETLGVETANQLKRDIYGVVQSSYGKGLLEVPAKTEAQKIIAYGIKNEIEKVVPEIKDLNARQAIFIQAKKAIDKTIARQTGKGIAGTGVGLTDLLTLIGGTGLGTVSGNPLLGVGAFGAKKIAESPAFLSVTSKGAEKLLTLFNNSSPTQKIMIYLTLRGIISSSTK